MRAIIIRMPDELKNAIDEAAKDSGVSVAWWARQTFYLRLKAEGVRVENVHPQHLDKLDKGET